MVTGRYYFFGHIYRYPEVCCNRYVAAFIETSVLKGVRINYSAAKYQNSKIKLLSILQKIYLLIAFFTLSVLNEIFETQKLPKGMFLFIKSCNQIFVTCLFSQIVLIGENKNTDYLTPT